MSDIVQHLRSITPNELPQGRVPGEMFINFPDSRVGYINDQGTPVVLPDALKVLLRDGTTTAMVRLSVAPSGTPYG